MNTSRNNLRAPNDLPIAGVRLENGEISDFEFHYKNDTWAYGMPPGTSSQIDRANGIKLVDTEGGSWNETDVVFYSLPNL